MEGFKCLSEQRNVETELRIELESLKPVNKLTVISRNEYVIYSSTQLRLNELDA